MYRRSLKTSQLNLFSNVDTLLKGKALKVYTEAEKWNNQFRIQVTSCIDEDIFRPLFDEHHGAPNASIRVLTGMFKINGAKIRMDSKLPGSNIVWYSRYELIHETVRQAYLRAKSRIDSLLSGDEISLLGHIAGEKGNMVSYRSTGSEIETELSQLMIVIYKIINRIDDDSSVSLSTLRRVFNGKYEVVNNAVSTRPKQEISTASVQSPHDTECQYRQKDDQQVRGYAVNVTETCDSGDSFNPVTNVLVDTAGAADCDFLQTAIEETKETVTGKIETANADGSYHSPENQDYCMENEIDLIVGAIQLGYYYPNAKSRYRGLIKHKMRASCRCFWINFVRIGNFVTGSSPNYALKSVNRRIFPHLCAQNEKIWQTLHCFLRFLTGWSEDVALFFGLNQFAPIFFRKTAEMMIFKK